MFTKGDSQPLIDTKSAILPISHLRWPTGPPFLVWRLQYSE